MAMLRVKSKEGCKIVLTYFNTATVVVAAAAEVNINDDIPTQCLVVHEIQLWNLYSATL
jgi:hypothetical protein